MFQAKIWYINTRTNEIITTIELYCDDETFLDDIVSDFVDTFSSDKIVLKYIVIELENNIMR